MILELVRLITVKSPPFNLRTFRTTFVLIGTYRGDVIFTFIYQALGFILSEFELQL